MPRCCAYNCSNSKNLFRLPRDKSRRKVWLQKINRKDLPTEIPLTQDVRLCSLHFEADQFEEIPFTQDGKKKLRQFAVPTLFSHTVLKNKRKPPKSREQQCVTTNTPVVSAQVQSDHSYFQHPPDTIAVNEPTPSCSNVNEFNDEPQDATRSSLPNELANAKRKIKDLEQKLQCQTEHLTNFLNADQLLFLQCNNMRGYKWSNDTVKKALQIRLACGPTGYATIKDLGQPLPSERTLRRRLEGLKFMPGILFEVFQMLEIKVKQLNTFEKEAILMIDEMAIVPGLNYDSSSGKIVGMPTMPSASGTVSTKPASHALVFMLGGLTTRWKQVVAYHFTSGSFESETAKDTLFQIIQMCEKIGIFVNCVVSDMGGHNQALWRSCGIVCGRYSETVNSCPHPCDKESRRLFFMPDAPHLLKNIRNGWVANQVFYLSEETVLENNLPSNQVKLEYIDSLAELEKNNDLKLAPSITPSTVRPSHYDKMKVGLALRVFHSDVAAALECAVKLNKLPNDALATAWFIRCMHKWFKIISSRSRKLALDSNASDYDAIIAFLKSFQSLFESMQVGEKRHWKPIQSGILLCIKTIIDMQNLYLKEKNFKFILLSRLCQDALENLFSTIRATNPVPSALEFKRILRLISVSQYLRTNHNGSYEVDDSMYLSDFLKFSQQGSYSKSIWEEMEKMSDAEDEGEFDIEESFDFEEAFETPEEEQEPFCLSEEEQQSLYYLAGYVIKKVIKNNVLCDSCKASLTTSNNVEVDGVKSLTELKLNPQGECKKYGVFASIPAFELVRRAEKWFRSHQKDFFDPSVTISNAYESSFETVQDIPNCHNVARRIHQQFFKTRIHIYLKKYNGNLNGSHSKICGSKSLGMRIAVS